MLAGNGNHQAVDLVLLLQFGLVQVIYYTVCPHVLGAAVFFIHNEWSYCHPCQSEIGNVVLINLHASRDHGGRG